MLRPPFHRESLHDGPGPLGIAGPVHDHCPSLSTLAGFPARLALGHRLSCTWKVPDERLGHAKSECAEHADVEQPEQTANGN